MAMRQKPSPSRTQFLSRPLYEDFQPSAEKKENQEANFLHIQLPDFEKEQINITFVHASRTLKVYGERPSEVGGNRWVRFQQEYSVPENCEVGRLQGQLDQGVLTLTMPKKFFTPVSPKEVKTTQEEADAVRSKKAVAEPKSEKARDVTKSTPSRREEEPRDKVSAASVPGAVNGPAELKPRKGQEETSAEGTIDSRKPVADEMGMRAVIPPEPMRDSNPQKGQEHIVQKSTLTTGKPQMDQEEIEDKPILKVVPRKQTQEKPQNRQEEIQEKPILKVVPRKRTEEKSQNGREEIEEKPILKVVPRKQTDEKPQNGREQTEPKFKITTAQKKQLDEQLQQLQEHLKQKTTLAAVHRKQTDEKIVRTRAEDAEKERVPKKEVKGADGMPSESRKPENDEEKFIIRQKERMARKEQDKAGEGSAPKTQEKEKTTGKAAVGDEGKRKENMADTLIGKGMKEMAATASQVANIIAEGKWDDEDKPLLVNMGVAALVIAALGAFVSYKFISSGKS